MRYAYEVIIDGVSCTQYEYMIAQLGDSTNDGMGTSEELITSGNNITSDLRLLGTTNKQPLKFKVSLAKIKDGQLHYLTTDDRDILDFWLTSKVGWRKIEFNQPDYMGKYYMGKVNNIEWKNVGNQIVSCEFEIETNSPYAHKEDEYKVFNLTGTSNTITIDNPTHGDLWTYPTIKLTMSTTGSDIKIKNVTDNNREFIITGLIANEVVEINCKNGMIKSSTELNRKGQCNFKYPRLAYGENEFAITGNIGKLEFTYTNDMRIGG